MERRKRFNHFPLMVPLSLERLEMRTRRFAHSTRLHTLKHVRKKIHWLHDTERKPACSKNTVGLEPVYCEFTVHLCGCGIFGSLDVNAPQRDAKCKLSLVCSFEIWVRIYVATAFCYPKWQAGWGLFLLTSPSLLSWGFSGMQDEIPLHYGPGLRYVRELNLSQHLKAFGEKKFAPLVCNVDPVCSLLFYSHPTSFPMNQCRLNSTPLNERQ